MKCPAIPASETRYRAREMWMWNNYSRFKNKALGASL